MSVNLERTRQNEIHFLFQATLHHGDGQQRKQTNGEEEILFGKLSNLSRPQLVYINKAQAYILSYKRLKNVNSNKILSLFNCLGIICMKKMLLTEFHAAGIQLVSYMAGTILCTIEFFQLWCAMRKKFEMPRPL